MQKIQNFIGIALIASAGNFIAGSTPMPQDGPSQREIGRTTEKELKIVLNSSFGSIIVSRGEPGKVLVLDSSPHMKDDPNINIDYAVRNRVGYLDLSLGEGSKENEGKRGTFKINHFDGGKWYLKFSDDVPISFDVQLGLGKGDFDLSGLQVKDFNLSTGASDVTLSFDEPNRSKIDNISIESGVSKFDGRNLCNANFKRFRFQGGVGAYTLDFGGALRSEVDVDIEVGLGILTIYIPTQVGARIFYEKSWVSKVDCPEDFESSGDNEYISENYYSSTGKMNIRLDCGMESVKIRRR